MQRESFIFYRSFRDVLKYFSRKIQMEVSLAISDYALDGVEPEYLKGASMGLFLAFKPQIDESAKAIKGK